MKRIANVLMRLVLCSSVGYAGGEGELQDYRLSATALELLREYEQVQTDRFLTTEAIDGLTDVLDDARKWLAQIDSLGGDEAAFYYLRAMVEYDAANRLDGIGEDVHRDGALSRALDHIERFVGERVAFADGHALHGAILGRKISGNPGSAMLYAGAAKTANTTALRLDPDNQLAHLNLGFTFANTPKAFGGDRKLAVGHFRSAFERGNLALRAVAGVWLSITYDQLGDFSRAIAVIEDVLRLAPGFPQAEATARALADGIDPLIYWERLQENAQ